MNQDILSDLEFQAGLVAGGGLRADMARKTHYVIECVRNGELIWTEEFDNLVVTAGLTDSIDKHFKGSNYTAAWYVGLTENSPTFAAGDTMGGAHAGWVETYNYDEANRPTLTLGTVTSGSADNSASKATFTISTGGDAVGGAFLVTNSTKGGTTGTLYGGGAFSQNRSLLAADVLNVTVTVSAVAAA